MHKRLLILIGAVAFLIIPVYFAAHINSENSSLVVSSNNNNVEETILTMTPVPTFAPVPSATPKPLPSPTNSPTPTPTVPPTPTPELQNTQLSQVFDETEVREFRDTKVFIGTGQVYSMSQAVGSNSDFWICDPEGDMAWFEEKLQEAKEFLGEGSSLIVSVGENDLTDFTAYTDLLNSVAEHLGEQDIKLYFVSVGPVSDSYEENLDVMNFNTYLYNNLKGFYFIDVYNFLVENGFSFSGNSYDSETSYKAYEYILSSLE